MMGIFSKLNFRAVHEAYCHVTAVNFLAELSCLIFDAANEPTQTVQIGTYVDRAAQEITNSIFLLTNGSGMNHAAGLSRLSEISSSYKRVLRIEFGKEAQVVLVTKYCWEHFNVTSEKVVQAVYNGYLSLSASDAMMLIDKNEKRMQDAAHKFAKRNEDYIHSLEEKIKAKEASYRHYQNNVADEIKNTQRPGFKERDDRAVHRRAPIDEINNTQRPGFIERDDRAVHRRAPIDEPKSVGASPDEKQSKDIEPPLSLGDNYYLLRCPKCRQKISVQIHTIVTAYCPTCLYSWEQSIG
jgi:hypothetical protein